MGVGAIRELAILRELEYLLEIAGKLFLLDIEGTKALDARSINEIATLWQLQHLAEGGGVHTAIVSLANLCRALCGIWNELIDERRLAHTAIATQE